MNIKFFLAAAALTVPNAANAQVNWGLLKQPDYARSAIQAQQAGQYAREQREAALRAQQQADREAMEAAQAQAARTALLQAREANMPKIAELVKAGDCRGAVSLAVSYSDWESASRLNELCARMPANTPQ